MFNQKECIGWRVHTILYTIQSNLIADLKCVSMCLCEKHFNIMGSHTFKVPTYRQVQMMQCGGDYWGLRTAKWPEDKLRAYTPSDVCGSVWWSVCGWACLLVCGSERGRGWDWATLTVSNRDGASKMLSAGYSCIIAPSWTPSLLQDWQLHWDILSTNLSTWGDSSLPGHSRVTCYTHTHTYC